jgi:hypothetical protein
MTRPARAGVRVPTRAGVRGAEGIPCGACAGAFVGALRLPIRPPE